MKKQFWPYYLSRALISGSFAVLMFGLTWQALAFALVTFGVFLLYLHSGWFFVDAQNPLFPLRRDNRGKAAQRKALIFAVGVGLFASVLLPVLPHFGGVSLPGHFTLSLAIVTYFFAQFLLLSRA